MAKFAWYINLNRMSHRIKNIALLKKILWIDFAMGASTGALGMLLTGFLAELFGLPGAFLFWISAITAAYAVVALSLNVSPGISIPRLRALIFANWAWVPVSLLFIYLHFPIATLLGKLFLLLQIIVVGGLAWLEGRQLERGN